MIVNMGPHHPSMHGVLRLIVTLDGEDVIDCEPILGYLHRGMEKIGGKPNNYTIFALCNTLGLFSYYVHRSNNSKWAGTVGKYSSTEKSQLYQSYFVGVESYSFSSVMAWPFYGGYCGSL
ncbi:NAD(P)H-quinone oxidoreductase subunit H, chloroplastic [Linum perenne]